MTDHWCTYCQGVNAHNCQFNPNLPRTEVYTTNTTATQPKTRPLRAEVETSETVNVIGMPEFDGLLDHIYEHGTAADGVVEKANAFARAVIARYAPQQPARLVGNGCHCATCTCHPGMTPAVRFDTTPAEHEGVIRDRLIALGWTPPGVQQSAPHPAITHCDNCGCDWLDNGLNPVGCPYCKQSEQAIKIEALRAEVERLKSMTAVTMGVGRGDGNLFVHGDYDSIKAAQALVIRAERLEKALKDIRSLSSINSAMNPNSFALTVLLADIHHIADSVLAKESDNDNR